MDAGLLTTSGGAALPGAVCELCGAPARVHALIGYRAGHPVRRHSCLACAPQVAATSEAAAQRQSRTRLTTVGIAVGVGLMLIGVFHDWLVPHTSGGFGRYQLTAVVFGAALLVVGIALRSDVVTIASFVMIVGTGLADIVAAQVSPGVGWKQALAIKVGLIVAALAWVLRRESNRRRAARRRLAAADGHVGSSSELADD